MKKRTVLIALLLPLALSVSAEEKNRGEEIFTTVCMTCHKFERGPNMIAPPIFGVKNHYLNAHPDKAGFVKRVSSWLKKQDRENSLMPGAVRRFKLMPPIDLSESDRAAVAGFIYNADFSEPSWYAGHYQAEHGTK